jgi:exopolyphosphatase / guanosine-5'-triphosphate,3'-diphosphate pyrophosphatase
MNKEYKRIAAIDIGTVTCRLFVAETNGKEIKKLYKKSVITNLGEGVDATGVLKSEAIARVCETVKEYLFTIDSLEHDVQLPATQEKTQLVVVATSASRDAKNANEFSEKMSALGAPLTIIPGEREAQLSFLGASAGFENEMLLVVDSGGGSTEVIVGKAGSAPLKSHSFDIGCRRITERFLHSDPPTKKEIDEARIWVRSQFEPYFDNLREAFVLPSFDEVSERNEHTEKICAQPLRSEDSATCTNQVLSEDLHTRNQPLRAICVAGTATTMVSIYKKLAVYDSSQVHGASITTQQLDQIFELLSTFPLEQRKKVCGLQPQRAAVIVGGTLILQEVLRAANLDSFTASESDILQGIILSAVQE